MKIYLASDHAGFQMKGELLKFVKELGFEVEDCGAYELNKDDDYPEFVKKAAEAVSNSAKATLDKSEATGEARAIVLGGSGQGEAIVANRFQNIRAAVFYGGPKEIITLSREHNDANVLSLGARFLSLDEAKEAVKLWLETPFSNEERHKRRISKIDTL